MSLYQHASNFDPPWGQTIPQRRCNIRSIDATGRSDFSLRLMAARQPDFRRGAWPSRPHGAKRGGFHASTVIDH
jgi:hypothetical protein